MTKKKFLNISIITSAENDKHAYFLLKSFGFPLIEKNKKGN